MAVSTTARDASGHEVANAELLRSELEGLRLRPRDLRTAARPRLARGADRGKRPGRAGALLSRAHRRRAGERRDMEPRPVRGRARRRGGLGQRRRRHVEHHSLDGRRLPAPRPERVPSEGQPHPGRRRRRGGPRLPRRRLADRARRRRRGADYVITESGGIPIETPGGRRLPIIVGEKGSCWCRVRVRGRGGPRLDAAPHRQRARHRRRGRPAPRGVQAGGDDS